MSAYKSPRASSAFGEFTDNPVQVARGVNLWESGNKHQKSRLKGTKKRLGYVGQEMKPMRGPGEVPRLMSGKLSYHRWRDGS